MPKTSKHTSSLPLGSIDPIVSKNFENLKSCSILMVVIGHFFKEIDILWVPVTIGLLIFSFSSGYFTGKKYRGKFNLKAFWRKKIERLGLNLLLINLVLLCLFLIQKKPGIWTWHTLINVLGLNGFLNWFHIQNISPFGRGMWFFTLLLIFYVSYPLLERLKKKQMAFFSFLFVIFAFYLNIRINFGHALWLTGCGFVLGTFFGRYDLEIPQTISMGMVILLFFLMFVTNFIFNFQSANFLLMLMFALFLIFSVIRIHFPQSVLFIPLFFSGCLLEIYLLHPYFSNILSGIHLLDFATSLFTILLISKSLSLISARIVSIRKRHS